LLSSPLSPRVFFLCSVAAPLPSMPPWATTVAAYPTTQDSQLLSSTPHVNNNNNNNNNNNKEASSLDHQQEHQQSRHPPTLSPMSLPSLRWTAQQRQPNTSSMPCYLLLFSLLPCNFFSLYWNLHVKCEFTFHSRIIINMVIGLGQRPCNVMARPISVQPKKKKEIVGPLIDPT